jgi:photosystem II stability/assembly factor-like uncharacterized protein
MAVGENGTIVRYSSGLNAWTNVPSGTTVSLRSIAASADANVVVVGGGGTILRSVTSGQSWSGVASGTTESLNRVIYATGAGFNYFVAVGDNGVIRKSTNGTTWTALTSGTTKRLVSIGYRIVGNVKLVALAEDSTVLVSENHGTNWSAITVNTPRPITYGSPDGVTGYAGDGIRMTTGDGTNWSYTFPSLTGFAGVGYGNGRFVALAGQSRMTSPDLVNWSITTTPLRSRVRQRPARLCRRGQFHLLQRVRLRLHGRLALALTNDPLSGLPERCDLRPGQVRGRGRKRDNYQLDEWDSLGEPHAGQHHGTTARHNLWQRSLCRRRHQQLRALLHEWGKLDRRRLWRLAEICHLREGIVCCRWRQWSHPHIR